MRFAGFILLAGLPGVIIGAVGAVHLPETPLKPAWCNTTLSLGHLFMAQ